jgi:hypothetical protein
VGAAGFDLTEVLEQDGSDLISAGGDGLQALEQGFVGEPCERGTMQHASEGTPGNWGLTAARPTSFLAVIGFSIRSRRKSVSARHPG